MGQRIRILHIVESFEGGVFTSVRQIVNGLDPDQFDVAIAYSRRSGTPEDLEKHFRPSVRLFHIPMTREIAPIADSVALLRLCRLIRRLRPTIVHAHSSKAGVLGRAAARLCGVPRVFYSPRGFSFLRADVPPIRRRLYRAIEATADRFGGTVVACSEGERDVARTMARRVVLIPNAVDLDYIRRAVGAPNGQRQDDALVVAICARIAPQRQPALFARVGETASAQRPDRLRFIWIGGGEVPPALVSSSVQLTGWLPREAGLRLLANDVDIYLHTSRWEGMPLAILEAMALGKPVVATDVLGNRDAVIDGQTGFLARTVDDLVGGVLRLADDAELRRQLGEAGRRRVETVFSLPTQIERFGRLYRGEMRSTVPTLDRDTVVSPGSAHV